MTLEAPTTTGARNHRIVKLGAAIRILPLVGLLLIGFGVNAQSTQSRQQSERYVVDYYYTAKWGFADEFIRLFRKNHFPVLKKQIETGRIVEVTASRPRYHATEDGRWDYRVTITWKNVAASIDNSGEDAIIKQLYPDQETFRREEQRRFEILLAHWDVPVVSVPLDQ